MADFKITHIFDTGIRSNGWSETWYLSADGPIAAQNKGRLIAQKRIDLLASRYVLHYQRHTDRLPQDSKKGIRRVRNAGLIAVNLTGKPGGGSSGDPDLPWQACLCRIGNDDLSTFRNFLLRGIPDELWSGGNDMSAQLFMQNQLGAFIKVLSDQGVYIWHRNRDPNVGGGLPFIKVFITSGNFERMVKRSTGRPFGQDRGRK